MSSRVKVPKEAQLDPFNHYDTEFVKLDANGATEIDESGRMELPDSSSRPELAVLTPDEEPPINYRAPPDSINSKSFTDVTFIVGPPQHSKKYVGHRVLLAMTSPVFETMFYGDMSDKSKYIRVPDVAPIGFENLLRFAYTDSLNLTSVEDAMLTAYAAKKYLLPQLLQECLSYIEKNISPSTACVVFEFAQVLNSQQLVLRSMNLIDRQTIGVITNKSFNQVQASTVEFVANRKYLNLDSEFTLFNSILNWSLAECRRQGIRGDDWLEVRAILQRNSILSAVRFLSMTHDELTKAIIKSSKLISQRTAKFDESRKVTVDESKDNGEELVQNHRLVDVDDSNCLLNEAEQRAIFLNITQRNVAKLPNSVSSKTLVRQAPPEYFSLQRFRSSASLVTSTISTRNIKLISSKFQCLNENIFLVSLTIPIRLDVDAYTSRTPKFECHLKFSTRASQPTGSKQTIQPPLPALSSPQHSALGAANLIEPSTLLMDSIDESLQIAISKEKDCLVRLKRPILIRMGNINELALTFETYTLEEDLVALQQTHSSRSPVSTELTDTENINWLFFKSAGIEFSEFHYYY